MISVRVGVGELSRSPQQTNPQQTNPQLSVHHRRQARASLVVSAFACFLLVVDGALILYATLLWPATSDSGKPDPLFVVGVVTFVVCFTLPFALVVALMVNRRAARQIHKDNNFPHQGPAVPNS